MSYFLDQKKKYRDANSAFDKDLNEEKYNESIKDISQKNRDKYKDEMVAEEIQKSKDRGDEVIGG